jgi:hypothetical protein
VRAKHARSIDSIESHELSSRANDALLSTSSQMLPVVFTINLPVVFGRNAASLVPSGTRWRPHHNHGWCGLSRLSSHSVQVQRLAQEPRGLYEFF